MRASVSKLLLPVAGKPVLARTLDTLSNVPEIRKAVVLCRDEDRSAFEALSGSPKVTFAAGGAMRQESVRRGIQALEALVPPGERKGSLVLIHDAARCLVTEALIAACIAAAHEHGAAIAAAPVSDTLKLVGEDGVIQKTVPRAGLWAVQTPQVFRWDILVRAHESAEDDEATDDSMLVERIAPVRIVEAPKGNLKITTPEDLFLAARLV